MNGTIQNGYTLTVTTFPRSNTRKRSTGDKHQPPERPATKQTSLQDHRGAPEYDKAAKTVDHALVGCAPSRGQLHRWLSGELKGLPYPDHCRVLEAMFPGWTVQQLFEPWSSDAEGSQPPRVLASTANPPLTGAVASQAASAVAVSSPVGIRPHLERAFQSEHVAIDFFGFSGETLHGVIQGPLDTVRAGELKPRTVTIRILVPDTAAPMAVPCRRDDLGDDPEFRDRATGILLRHGQAILDSVQELADLGRVEHAEAQIRVHGCPPLFKLYILNRQDAFFGFYPITEHKVTINGSPHEMFDLMGKDASLFHYSCHDDSAPAGHYVAQAGQWFDTVWNTISRPFTPR